MRVLVILLAFVLLSCGRPLTPAEKSFATQMHGPSIDTSRIRFMNGALVGKVTRKRQKRPRLACRERIFPEPTSEYVTVGPAAIALHNKVFYSKDWYAKNFLPEYPDRFPLWEAMLFAHEIAHVWQWQNRAKTGYTPFRVAGEHGGGRDPYLFDVNTKTQLLDYPYEQQASIVEEYVCCAALDPDAPRTKRLEDMLRGAFPMGRLSIPDQIYIPWKDAKVSGICH